MASLTEFYLASLWEYKPKAVKRILNSLANTGSDDVEFAFDDEYHWFRVVCPEEEAESIREQYNTIAAEIEENAFEHDDDDDNESILDSEGVIREYFDNEWIAKPGTVSADDVVEAEEPSCVPKDLSQFSHTAVWDDLDKNNETFIIPDVVTVDQLIRITKETGVGTFRGLSGRLIYIGGDSEESINKARNKLKVLLAIKKIALTKFSSDHLIYAEDFVDRTSDPFMADMRYLANIDPRLVTSTLLDRAIVDNLEESYRRIYEQGASIRLCCWDPDKRCWVSFFGPKVAPRSSGSRILVNRPTVSAKDVSNLGAGPELATPGQKQSHEARAHVASWIEGLPDTTRPGAAGNVGLPTDGASAPIPSTVSLGGGLDSRAPETPAMVRLTASQRHGPSVTATPGNDDSTPPTPKPDLKIDTKIASISQKFSNTQLAVPRPTVPGARPEAQPSKQATSELSFTGPECLIDMLDAVETVSSDTSPLRSVIHWGMPALIPSPCGCEEAKDTETDLVTGLDKHPFMGYLKSSATDFQPTGNLEPSLEIETPPLSSPETPMSGDILPAQPMDSHSRDPSQSSNPNKFNDVVERAMVRLLSTAPYRRGRVALRAEFGRAILGGLDESALAFNASHAESNGWAEGELLRDLNAQYAQGKNLHFTKVLTTYGWDVEDMVETKTKETRLWEQRPARCWATYSFHCVMSDMDGVKFIVDIEDAGSNDAQFTYSVRMSSTSPGSKPVYIHAIQHHWDVRITLTHTDSEKLETAFGAFAESLLQSLSVSHDENGSPLLKFAVHSSFPVQITDVRVLTKWRHSSTKTRSILEITEVEQLEVCPYTIGPYAASKAGWNGSLARPWTYRETKQRRDNGEFPRWYEAAVVSPDAEELFRQNAVMGFAERTEWDAQGLQASGLFADIYGPALEMVKQMDRVGRNDENHQSRKYNVLRKNDAPGTVPGGRVEW